MAAKAKVGFGALLVFALGFFTFLPTLRVGFMLDDAFLVPRVKPEWTLAHLRDDFTTNVHDDPTTALYRPVQKMMVRLQYSISGTAPWGYHALSLAFHTANGVLILLLVAALGASPLASLLSGAFYAVHPLIVDDLLAGTGGEAMAIFFTLIALYGLFAEGRWPLRTVGGIAFVLALFSKESAVIIPGLLVLLFWATKRPARQYLRLVPLVLCLVPYGLLRAHAVGTIEGLSPSWVGRFAVTAFPKICGVAVLRILFPWDLESWPPIPSMSALWPLYGGILLALIAVIVWKRKRFLGLGLGWFLLGFGIRIPAMILGQAVFDKWISFASIGVLMLLAVGIALKLQHSKGDGRFLWGTLAVLLIGGWGKASVWNIELRGTDEKNYLWAMRHEFRDFAAYRLSVIYLKTGRSVQAIPYLETLLERDPENPDVQNTLAMARWHHGERTRAVEDLRKLLKKNPNYAAARENLARMLSRGLGQ